MSWFKTLQLPRSPGRTPSSSRPPSRSGEPTPDNRLLFQSFEWHTPSEPPAPDQTHSPNSHYARLTRTLPSLRELGVTSLWLPPGCKANNPRGNGYDCYDLWDLGEFDQKYARSTRWGSREELDDLLQAAQKEGVECFWDAVLNHKTAGDAVEECWAVEVDKADRRVETCAPKKIQAWLRYDFPGREKQGMKYSTFKWHAEHFNGTDWDEKQKKNAIYKLIDDPASYGKSFLQQTPLLESGLNRVARLAGKGNKAAVPARRPGKGWAKDVDDLHGNFDYLMFSNIDYTHADVKAEVIKWGQWMIEDVGVDGFRLDAVQHFSYRYTREWIAKVQEVSKRKRGRDAFIVGEIWTGELRRILKWMDSVGQNSFAYDSPLLYNFSRISEDVRMGSQNADLRTILRDSLVQSRPLNAVTLVTNHDTQRGQTSYTPIDSHLKSLFYAFILLRENGLPCVFWGDVYGTQGAKTEPWACVVPDSKGGKRSLLPDLMLARKLFAYGAQTDYFDAMSCIGWTRAGTHDRPGCAVIMSIGSASQKRKSMNDVGMSNHTLKKMTIGMPGETWVDIMANEEDRAIVVIDAKGQGLFPCTAKSVGVFVRKTVQGIDRFPVGFDHDVYK